MKKNLLIIVMLLISFFAWAQEPGEYNYYFDYGVVDGNILFLRYVLKTDLELQVFIIVKVNNEEPKAYMPEYVYLVPENERESEVDDYPINCFAIPNFKKGDVIQIRLGFVYDKRPLVSEEYYEYIFDPNDSIVLDIPGKTI